MKRLPRKMMDEVRPGDVLSYADGKVCVVEKVTRVKSVGPYGERLDYVITHTDDSFRILHRHADVAFITQEEEIAS